MGGVDEVVREWLCHVLIHCLMLWINRWIIFTAKKARERERERERERAERERERSSSRKQKNITHFTDSVPY